MIVCPMKRALPPLHFCHARKYHLLDFATTKVQRCNLCRNASTALVQKNSSNTFKTAKTLPVFADAKIHELSSFQLSNKVSVTMESISLKPRDAVGKDLVSKCKDGYKALAAPILDIEDSARDSRDEGEIILGDFTIISNPDYAIVLKPNDLISFSSCLNTPNTSQYLVTLFEAHIPFHQFTFSSGALRMLSLPNAGGNSDNSEALSFDFLHRVFNAQLLKAEMEIKYANKNWKKTDYVAKIKNHVVGVSVTRAVGYPRPGDFSEDQAVSLLKKKLFGIKVSTVGVAEEDKWERQLLHIWVQDKQQANFISGAYQSLHPKLRGDTIVIVTIAGNHKWIFS
ncbi:putative Signal transducing adapter molecule 2 [Monocercomonoides exilis]|uniref:putative Signal transducing adapter molecule 2 n=1 Tax=Monocercomonoides exilis TaxID=2049356 RepID=UPI00355A0FE1|nr:putative Signal transducing adapter molecule 2 [Monocercomonoides exilis]